MSKRTTVRIPDDLYRWLAERAVRERRTVSNLLVALLSEVREREQAPIGQVIGSERPTPIGLCDIVRKGDGSLPQ